MIYNFKINNDKLLPLSTMSGCSGNTNTYICRFKIVSDYQNLTWYCVFSVGSNNYITLISTDTEGYYAIIPQEVLVNKNLAKIGCYATNNSQNALKRVSTNWLPFDVKKGAYSQGTTPATPTPSVWEQLVAKTVPLIGQNGNWYLYDMQQQTYVDTNVYAKGEDGADGEDGHTPVITATKVGKITTIKSDGVGIATINDGTDGINGTDGRDGTDGEDGHTPVKGVDYFTQQDIASLGISEKANKASPSTSGNFAGLDDNGNLTDSGKKPSDFQDKIDSTHKLSSDFVDDTTQDNKFVTSAEKSIWNNKGDYSKPPGGIPKTDLASDVQTSLGKADSAIQSHQDISGKENTSNKVTYLSSSSTDTQYPSAKCVYNLVGNIESALEALL